MEIPEYSLDKTSFSYLDLTAQDLWKSWTVDFTSITVVGSLTSTGRFHIEGKVLRFQVSTVASTSLATLAGTNYMALPIAAKGIGGMAVMTNATTNIAVGLCHIDATNSRCYLPTQAASGNTFTVCGWYEIG